MHYINNKALAAKNLFYIISHIFHNFLMCVMMRLSNTLVSVARIIHQDNINSMCSTT